MSQGSTQQRAQQTPNREINILKDEHVSKSDHTTDFVLIPDVNHFRVHSEGLYPHKDRWIPISASSGSMKQCREAKFGSFIMEKYISHYAWSPRKTVY